MNPRIKSERGNLRGAPKHGDLCIVIQSKDLNALLDYIDELEAILDDIAQPAADALAEAATRPPSP